MAAFGYLFPITVHNDHHLLLSTGDDGCSGKASCCEPVNPGQLPDYKISYSPLLYSNICLEFNFSLSDKLLFHCYSPLHLR